MKDSRLLLTGCTLLFLVASVVGQEREPLTVNLDQPQLFIDDYLIDEVRGLKRTLRQPEDASENPVILPEHPWEHRRIPYGSVWYDGERKKFRCWYLTLNIYDSRPGFRGYRKQHHVPIHEAAYAESDDGIRWRKPELGLHEFRGSRKNNILLTCPGTHFDSTSVIHTPHDRERPWKLISFIGLWPYKQDLIKKQWGDTKFGVKQAGHYGWSSKDGIHWEAMNGGQPVLRASDRSMFWWDPRQQIYAGAAKSSLNRKRAQLYATSPDAINWTRTSTWLHTADERDHPGDEAEAAYGFRYGDQYVGFCEMRRVRKGQPTKINWELMTSRDGRNWNRPIREMFFADGPEQSWRYQVFKIFANPPVEHDGKLWIYYGGKAGTVSVEEGTEPFQALCVATLRKDGFVSLDADESGGHLVTRPLVAVGKRLSLNVSCGKGGYAKVALLDKRGTPLAGFGLADCQPIATDSLDQVVSWKAGPDISGLSGQVIRVHIELSDAQLYAVRFRNEPDSAVRSNLRFHASFDRDTAADVSQGKQQPVLNVGLRQTDGRIAKAVVLDAQSRLVFETAGHINPGSGTIVMWMRSQSESLRRSGFGLIDCGNAAGDNNDIFLAWFNSLQTVGGTFDAIGPAALRDKRVKIAPDRWYHVALAWDCRRGVRIDVNDQTILDRQVTWKPTPVSSRFVVGSDRAFSLPLVGAVDELTIYDRALSVDEVQQLRRRANNELPRFDYRKPYSGPLAKPRIDATSYMNRRQNRPLAAHPEIEDVDHIEIDYDRKFYSGHPQQAVFAYYGQGEIVIGYNRAPCNYETEKDVRHGPGGYHGRAEVVLRRSLDYGRTWPKSEEVIIYRESDPPEKKRAFLFQPTARRDELDMFSPDSLFFFTRTWLPELNGQLVCAGIRSADRGRAWESVPTIVPNPLIQGGDVLESCHPILRMPDGKTLLSAMSMNMPGAPKHSGPVLFESTDNGLSWHYRDLVRGKPSGTEGGRFAYPGLLRMPDGKLHCYFVHIGGRYEVDGVRNAICMTESHDKGKSWSDPVPITSNQGQGCWKNPGPLNEPPGASNYRAPWPILLRDGRILVLFNRRRMPVGIGGVLSSDGGKTWSHEFAIRSDGVSTDSGYPVGCQFEDGRIFVAYYYTKPDGNRFGGTRYVAGSFFRIVNLDD